MTTQNDKTEHSCASDCSTAIDATEDVFISELRMLRKVYETSRVLITAYRDHNVCDAFGGLDAIKQAHVVAVRSLEQWHAEADDSCR